MLDSATSATDASDIAVITSLLVDILRRERMPVAARCLTGIAPEAILLHRDGLEVRWVAASAVMTAVIDFPAKRNRHDERVDRTVGSRLRPLPIPSDGKHSVAIRTESTSPRPALSWPATIDATPETHASSRPDIERRWSRCHGVLPNRSERLVR